MQMESQHGRRQPAQLGATFYPGGTDDFYMPELVSPAPQRSVSKSRVCGITAAENAYTFSKGHARGPRTDPRQVSTSRTRW